MGHVRVSQSEQPPHPGVAFEGPARGVIGERAGSPGLGAAGAVYHARQDNCGKSLERAVLNRCLAVDRLREHRAEPDLQWGESDDG